MLSWRSNGEPVRSVWPTSPDIWSSAGVGKTVTLTVERDGRERNRRSRRDRHRRSIGGAIGQKRMAKDMARDKSVAIIGGGIGGLTAALAMLRAGIDVAVYEQAAELQELGAGVQISSNGTRVLAALGLKERDAAARRHRRRQGNPALEHRPDLEAVRPRRDLGRALRLALCDVSSRRSARDAARRDPRGQAGCDPSRPAVRWRDAGRRRRHHRVRGWHQRAGGVADWRDGVQSRVRACAVRRRPAGVHRHRCLARSRAARARAGGHQDGRRHQLGRARRPRGALSGARRRIDQSRRAAGARRLAGRILDRAGHHDEFAADFPRLARRYPRDDRAVDVPYKWALFQRPPMPAWTRAA